MHKAMAMTGFGLVFLGCNADYLHGKRCDSEQRCLEGYVCEPASGRCLWPWEIPDGGQDGEDSVCSTVPGTQLIYTNVTLNGNESTVEVDPGTTVEIKITYALSQKVGCNNCSNQFLFGLKSPAYGHQPLLCNHAGIPPPCPATLNGNINFGLQVPYGPGTYHLMSTVSQDANCDMALTNYFSWMAQRAAQAASIVVSEPDCPDSFAYLTGTRLNGQQSPLTVAGGQDVHFEADFAASQVQTCPDCEAQLVAGLEAQPVLCRDLGRLPACPAKKQGKLEGIFTVPSRPSIYLVKISLFTAADCQQAKNLYQTNPPARGWTVAVINVQ